MHAEFSPRFEPIFIDPTYGDQVAQGFIARGGLICLWDITRSSAGFTVCVAERSTKTDPDQIAEWALAGYTECSEFDACCCEKLTTDVGGFWTLHALIDGIELRVFTSSGSLDPLRAVAHAAATSIGYFRP